MFLNEMKRVRNGETVKQVNMKDSDGRIISGKNGGC